MPNLIKKSWTVSTPHLGPPKSPTNAFFFWKCAMVNSQGRSTVKGQMGHVSTSFCVSKDNFDQFWEQTLKESKELGIEDPKLKRKEKIPKK